MYCGKCGAELNEKGLCPNCDKNSRSKKKIVCISVIALFLIISILIAIIIFNNNDSSETGKEINKSIYSEQTEKTSNMNVNNYKELTYYSYNDFSEELAWINFADDEKSYYGCIDKTGKIVFLFDADGISEITDFSNGYAYISYQDCMKIIDKTGKIIGEYSIDETHKVAAYGDGYICTEERIADYNSSRYDYQIFNTDGTVLAASSSPDGQKYKYFGQGIFGYFSHEIGNSYYNVYFPEANKWIEQVDGFYFCDATTIMGKGRETIITIDNKGNKKSQSIPEGNHIWVVNDLVNDLSILYSYEEFLETYNYRENTFKKMDENISSMIEYDKLPPLTFSDGKIALPWNGSDDKNYVAIFDTEWNLVANPIPIDKFADYNDNLLYSYSDGRLIVENEESTIVYDEKCNEVFNSNTCGYSQISKYQNGVSKILDQSFPTYLDKDGNKLFEKIDTSVLV